MPAPGAAAAAAGGLPAGLLARRGHQPVGEIADRVVHRDRIPDVRRVPPALYHEQLGAGQLGDPVGPLGGDDLVLVATDHQDRSPAVYGDTRQRSMASRMKAQQQAGENDGTDHQHGP